jgi:hypothetical protein
MTCTKCGKVIASNAVKCPYCNTPVSDAGSVLFGGLLALGGLALGGYVVKKMVKAGFFKDIDWDSVGERLLKALEQTQYDFDSLRSNKERLNRVEELLRKGDSISIDEAALLVGAIMESGLRMVCTAKGIDNTVEPGEGMVELATRLNNESVISDLELRRVKEYTFKVRNPIVHGNFGTVTAADVTSQLEFTRRFFSDHGLINT